MFSHAVHSGSAEFKGFSNDRRSVLYLTQLLVLVWIISLKHVGLRLTPNSSARHLWTFLLAFCVLRDFTVLHVRVCWSFTFLLVAIGGFSLQVNVTVFPWVARLVLLDVFLFDGYTLVEIVVIILLLLFFLLFYRRLLLRVQNANRVPAMSL